VNGSISHRLDVELMIDIQTIVFRSFATDRCGQDYIDHKTAEVMQLLACNCLDVELMIDIQTIVFRSCY
jgi:hypothetical protein